MPTGLTRAGWPAPSAGALGWSACDSHVFGDRTGDNDPLACGPMWMIAGTPFLPAHRSSACSSQPDADDLVVAHVVPLVEGERRELDRRDVCLGSPTGQGPGPTGGPTERSDHPPEAGTPSMPTRSRVSFTSLPPSLTRLIRLDLGDGGHTQATSAVAAAATVDNPLWTTAPVVHTSV